ncbi:MULTISPECIES: hypothetical protein [Pontibacillus]|uniref:DUF3098 domain-containing protein n=1 Tax=Pontibacillus chungwhensis TaxID=265426 RepID=A0ABY8V1E2_9BACI|nr:MULTISPECIES: hypothetical protein [Pontibacillus]MCD5324379.1 hypothetical protein [Pontibacillus sp. HN14]WIF99323.1 hypothetical protein QNI29_06610 [Pontibacillus chungwhensis]
MNKSILYTLGIILFAMGATEVFGLVDYPDAYRPIGIALFVIGLLVIIGSNFVPKKEQK